MAKQPSKSVPTDSSARTPDERKEARRHIIEHVQQLRLDTPAAVCQNVADAPERWLLRCESPFWSVTPSQPSANCRPF
jgi:hypothetical protein